MTRLRSVRKTAKKTRARTTPNPPLQEKTEKIEIYQCPRHKEFFAVVINMYRITPSKCCGSWNTIRTWNVTKADLKEHLRSAIKSRP